jgi:hypothetical protein
MYISGLNRARLSRANAVSANVLWGDWDAGPDWIGEAWRWLRR